MILKQLPPTAYNAHVCLKSRCSLCSQAMRPDEPLRALLGNDVSTCPVFCTNRSLFPDVGHNLRQLHGMRLCRRPQCGRCAVSPEAATLHADCYDLFMLNCEPEDALDRLWTAAAWRHPWRDTPELDLDDSSFSSPRPSTTGSIGIPELASLPMEIVQFIRGYSSESLFWRYSTVQDVAERSSNHHHTTSAASTFQSFPLHEISAWERGGEPLPATDTPQLPIVRLLVDSHGIGKLERLPDWPKHTASRSDTRVYAFLDESRAKGFSIHFKFGRARLVPNERGQGLQVWDTPTPPLKNLSTLSSAYLPDTALFRTIELSQVTGLTFFYLLGSVLGIHAHTAKAPLATQTFERFSRRTQQSVIWVYVPLPRNDRVLRLGVRGSEPVMHKPSFLIRTKLAGDIVVGPCQRQDSHDFMFGNSPPTTLVFSSQGRKGLPFFGVKSNPGSSSEPPTPFPFPVPPGNPPSDLRPIHSSASLEDVDQIHIFNCASTGLCKGLVMKYKNGGKRAVGECRVGVDPVTTCAKPSWICFRRMLHSQRGVGVQLEANEVQCTRGDHHRHEEEGWVCLGMEGHVEFWFDNQASRLDIFRFE